MLLPVGGGRCCVDARRWKPALRAIAMIGAALADALANATVN
ncbi:MAG TPA: hypothetical protein PKC43_06435 [Phycisphaerales bacterium]|nr:hypothetical protein [Phycisphaerales bacterium]HMP37070.1 hypothetical protein [Phycisphaerales bacterium]